jgi:hypothetical protein
MVKTFLTACYELVELFVDETSKLIGILVLACQGVIDIKLPRSIRIQQRPEGSYVVMTFRSHRLYKHMLPHAYSYLL